MSVRASPLNHREPKEKSLTALSSAEAANEGDDETGDPEQTEDDDDPDVIDVPEGEGDFRGYGEEEDDKEMEDEDEEDEEPAPQAPSRPRRRYRGSQKHFSVLLTRGVIVPGNSLTVPALNNPGLVATMVVGLPSLMLHRRSTNSLFSM